MKIIFLDFLCFDQTLDWKLVDKRFKLEIILQNEFWKDLDERLNIWDYSRLDFCNSRDFLSVFILENSLRELIGYLIHSLNFICVCFSRLLLVLFPALGILLFIFHHEYHELTVHPILLLSVNEWIRMNQCLKDYFAL